MNFLSWFCTFSPYWLFYLRDLTLLSHGFIPVNGDGGSRSCLPTSILHSQKKPFCLLVNKKRLLLVKCVYVHWYLRRYMLFDNSIATKIYCCLVLFVCVVFFGKGNCQEDLCEYCMTRKWIGERKNRASAFLSLLLGCFGRLVFLWYQHLLCMLFHKMFLLTRKTLKQNVNLLNNLSQLSTL